MITNGRLLSWVAIVVLFVLVYVMAAPEFTENGSVILFTDIIDVTVCIAPGWGCAN